MPITYLAAAQEIARSIGGSGVSAELTIAKTALVDAIREIDSRHDWEFTLQTLADITVNSGTAEYTLAPSGSDPPIKKIYSARLKTNKRTLSYTRQREWDRVIREQETNGIPTHYTEVRAASSLKIRLLPTPSMGDLLQPRVYTHIQTTYTDSDNLAIPDRYLPAFLGLGRYNFIIARDAEDARAQLYLQKAEARIADAIRDDLGNPDEDIRLIPTDEWIGAQGPTDYLFGWGEW